MQLELVLFDLDHTLFDTNKSQALAFQQTMKHIGADYSHDSLENFRAVNTSLWKKLELGQASKEYILENRFKLFFENSGTSLASHNYNEMNDIFLEHLSKSYHLMDGAHDICKKIKHKYPLGVITNGDAKTQKQRLAGSKLEQYFNFVVISDEVGFTKPDKRIFDAALQKHSHTIKPEQSIIIGDNFTADILGGKNAGFKTCWFNPQNLPSPSQDYCPDFMVSNLSELLTIFDAQNHWNI